MYRLTLLPTHLLLYVTNVTSDKSFKINLSLFWPILFCIMCLMLIIIPLVTETRDTLIGCGLLILGFIPYVLWVNQKYTPAPVCSFANAIERGIGKFMISQRKIQ